MARSALVVGVGPGLGASLARQLATAGYRTVLAARDAKKLAGLASEVDGLAFACDASRPEDVKRLFEQTIAAFGPPDVVAFNASGRQRGPLVDLDPALVLQALTVSAFGGFLVGQEAARAMLPRGSGVILFTGASASIKGFAQSAPFAMGKFAMRGLAQSMARELGPKGIHVAHMIIDGGILSPNNPNPVDQPDSRLDPDAIAQAYMDVIGQARSAWSHEVDLRSWSERF